MFVGALAVATHGAPRYTADMDVVVHLPFQERDRVRSVLENAGWGSFEERRDALWGQRLVGVGPEQIPVEVFFTSANEVHDREFARRVAIEVERTRVWMISPEDLVLRKLVNTRLRREHDFEDAVAVLRTQARRFDPAYVRRHCAPHRVCTLFEEALRQAGRSQETP